MHCVKRILFFLASVLLFLCTQTTALAESHKAAPHSYSSAVKIAAPSVVNVYTARRKSQPQNVARQTPKKKRRASLGSGVIIDAKGDLLTNYHVVRNAAHILVALDDGRRVKAKVVGLDRETDLAVLHINLKDLPVAVIGDSDKVHVGDIVLAIGNPFGLGQTVTQGIVSAIGRNTIGINQLENYIQTDAAINPGNSGGALVNTKGQVIGINTGIYSRSGGYQGVGFAIPINVALNVMHQIIETGSVKRGWLGVRIRTVVPALVRSMRLSRTYGVVIMSVSPDSPAAKKGLRRGDVITSLNNQRVRSAQGFLSYIAQRKPGSNIVLLLTRDNQTYRIEIKIGTRPPQPLIDDRGSEQLQ